MQILRLVTTVLACALMHTATSQVNVTFRVDMSNEMVTSKGVHVAGDFQSEAGFGGDWQPGATQLYDNDGDGVYEVSVVIPSGTYLYKFVNGNSWQDQPELPSSDCGIVDGDGNINRQVTIGADDVVLPVITFNECGTLLSIGVVMNDVDISDKGVFVMGDFQKAAGFASDWDPAATQMLDKNKDGAYEIDLQVPPGNYTMVFINGNTLEEVEVIACDDSVETPFEFRGRGITVSEGRNERQSYCYSLCSPCDPRLSTNYKTEWWNDVVFYEIFVRSFYDSDGDGIGDFKGLTEKLDYLNDGDPNTTEDLGIGGIWLMPMMPSPSYHGYDVTDYFGVESDYGTMEDFEEFIDAAHERGIKVIIDFVMNHSSTEHTWFQQSAAGQNGYRDWYIWKDSNPGFNGPWGQTVWHRRNGDYYYGLFWGGMPDLNYDNPEVTAKIFESAEFWLEQGVDGFRLDAIKYLDEDGNVLENTPETFRLLEDFNALYKSRNPDAVSVGEVWSSTSSIIPYVQDDRLDLCFDFDLSFSILDAVNLNEPNRISSQLVTIQDNYPKLQYATFLTNHDINRVMNTLGSISKTKQAATLYLTMPGVPFVYYGEEVAMKGTKPDENIRRPMQWSDEEHGGFSTVSPWYSLGDDWEDNHVAGMSSDSSSLLNHYRKLIQFRNRSHALRRGYLLNLEASDKALAFARIAEDSAVITLTHFQTVPAKPVISMATSTLSTGTYTIVDVLTDRSLGTVEINENGGFDDWTPSEVYLNPRQSLVLSLTPATGTSTRLPAAREELSVEVFPNPASEQIIVRLLEPFKSVTLEMLSSDGIVVRRAVSQDTEIDLNITDLPSGLYFIRTIAGQKASITAVYVD